MALEQAIKEHADYSYQFSCTSLQGFDPKSTLKAINQADVIIAANASPAQSAVEIGGMGDLADDPEFTVAKSEQNAVLEKLLHHAHAASKKTVFISLRAPYDITKFSQYADAILATYAYNIDIDNNVKVAGPAFTALAKVLVGKHIATGILPVTVNGTQRN
jgi:beta-N-acetylhexosaminidase